MNFSIKSLATDIIELDLTFVRDTGLNEDVAKSLQELSEQSAYAGMTIAETDVSFRGLTKSMVGFTRMGDESRKFLTHQAVLLGRAGVSAEAFGKSTQG